MTDRTLVKVSAGKNCIGFRTVTRQKKSPQQFLMIREKLEATAHEDEVTVSDIHSFAVLTRKPSAGTLDIKFTWLSGSPTQLAGWEQWVTLPHEKLLAFVRASAREDGPKEYQMLSCQAASRPKLVFLSKERLRECVKNKIIRHKLSLVLRDNFNYPYTDRILFGRDFEPFSFSFREERGGVPGICGGLIFHSCEGDLKKGYYSVYT